MLQAGVSARPVSVHIDCTKGTEIVILGKSSRRFTLAAVTITVLATFASPVASAGNHAVRVPTRAAEGLPGLGIQTQIDLDYGSFRWLVVDDEGLLALQQSAVNFTLVPDAGTVQVQEFRFDPADGVPLVSDGLRADPDRAGLHLLQLVAPVRDEWISQLEAAGIELLQYYPHNSYLVWAEPNALGELQALPFVRWQGPFHPAYKINSNLGGRTGTIQNLDVMFYNNGSVADVLEELEKFGGVVLRHAPSQPDGRFFSAIVSANATQIETIARMGHVLWLGYQSPEPGFDDEMSDQIIADNHPGGVPVTGYNAHLAGLGVDGTGVVWATVDTGVDYDHPDLGPRIVGGYTFPSTCSGPPGNDCPGGGHGTHVSGIIGGDATAGYTDGSGFLYGLGVAPNYGIFAMNALMGAWPPVGGWQENSKQGVLGGAIGGNNSWWTGSSNNGYQSAERTHDLMVRDGNFDTAGTAEPFIEVFSAGNSGPSTGTLTAPKEAKNLIVTASTRNYRAGNIDTLSSFSSRGPAHDGRWVPTIAAPGETIASARNDDGGSCSTSISGTSNLYAYCSGTSMAAPHTSGVIVLATQWWRGFNGGADPSPAMAKALLVNSADDMATPDIPNIHEGWGRINLTTLINAPALRGYWDQTDTFTNTGEQIQIAVGVPDPGQPLKVSLAWSDAPGAVGANPALVNNLDLTVETDGATYLGNDFSAGWSTTGGSADALNNLENVFVEAPGGSAIITIDATAIVGDGVPYNGDDTDQDFALVCTNCALQPDFTLDVAPGAISVCAPDDAEYDIIVDSILSYNDPVTLAATGEPAGTTVSFDTNPVAPPATSVLTIGSTASATPGSFTVTVSGDSTTGLKSRDVGLHIFDALPSQPTLTLPINGALNQSTTPTFEWSAAIQGGGYQLQVATDSAFTNLVLDMALDTPGYVVETDLNTNTEYFWRVGSSNPCGDGSWSATWSFVTEAQPGDCGFGTAPVAHFFDDFESGAPGWTHTSVTGPDTWALDGGITGTHSGSFVYHVDDYNTYSDQRLVSPSVTLPLDGTPITLQFWNYQSIEDKTGGCWDGAIVEISTDGGNNWTYLPAIHMLTDPYDGPVTGLSDLNGWCGDPQAWLKSVVDLDAYAGETAQFRFRMGTDGSVGVPDGHLGWDLDDITVQSCSEGVIGLPFADGFESGDWGQWSVTFP